jgi:hypothetical protein
MNIREIKRRRAEREKQMRIALKGHRDAQAREHQRLADVLDNLLKLKRECRAS